jgi:hypothetical protein
MICTHSRTGPGGVIEHRPRADFLRAAEGVQTLPREAVNEITLLEMRACPAVEALILPEKKLTRTGR